MFAKRTVKNQITLPKAIVSRFPGVEYFEVTAERDRIILAPGAAHELSAAIQVQRDL